MYIISKSFYIFSIHRSFDGARVSVNELAIVKFVLITDPYVTLSLHALLTTWSSFREAADRPPNPRGFLGTGSGPSGAAWRRGRLEVGSNEGSLRESRYPRDTFICTNIGRVMGGGGEVARRGIETYLLAQLAAPVLAATLIHSRELRLPLSSANFRARYAFLESVPVVVHLIPAAFAGTIDHTWARGNSTEKSASSASARSRAGALGLSSTRTQI